jgi:hypothetical protein
MVLRYLYCINTCKTDNKPRQTYHAQRNRLQLPGPSPLASFERLHVPRSVRSDNQYRRSSNPLLNIPEDLYESRTIHRKDDIYT